MRTESKYDIPESRLAQDSISVSEISDEANTSATLIKRRFDQLAQHFADVNKALLSSVNKLTPDLADVNERQKVGQVSQTFGEEMFAILHRLEDEVDLLLKTQRRLAEFI